MKTKITTVTAILLILAGGLISCEKQEQHTTDIAGTWKVKALNVSSNELLNVSLLPDDTLHSEILITIPNATSGHITGNTIHQTFEFELAFEIGEHEQIFIQCFLYVENQLLIRLAQGVDAHEFAANSNLGITPKELLASSWNTWLFETDGTKSLDELISILSQDSSVEIVSRNNRGVSERHHRYLHTFFWNICNTAKFNISNNELTFRDSQGNPLIIFTPLKKN